MKKESVKHQVLATIVAHHQISPERALALFRLIIENGLRLCEDLVNDSCRDDEREAISLQFETVPAQAGYGWHNIRITSDKLTTLKKLMDWQLREIGVDPDSVTRASIEQEYGVNTNERS